MCLWVLCVKRRDELNFLPAELKHPAQTPGKKELPCLEAMYLGRFGLAVEGSEPQGIGLIALAEQSSEDLALKKKPIPMFLNFSDFTKRGLHTLLKSTHPS